MRIRHGIEPTSRRVAARLTILLPDDDAKMASSGDRTSESHHVFDPTEGTANRAANGGVRPFDDDAVYTVSEVAMRMRFKTVKPVRAAIAAGRLRACRPAGRGIRILGADANAWWLASKLSPVTTETGYPLAHAAPSRRPRSRKSMPVLR
jgi:hypothetical protein